MTLHYTTLITPHHDYNCNCTCKHTTYTTLQPQSHYITTTATTATTTTTALHHTTSSSCGWGDRPGDHCNHCNHSKKHSSNHLSVHQWILSAIRDSQQPISPIGFLFWNFCRRLVRYYWYSIMQAYSWTLHCCSLVRSYFSFTVQPAQADGSTAWHRTVVFRDRDAFGCRLKSGKTLRARKQSAEFAKARSSANSRLDMM